MSEVDVGGMAVEAEPSHQYSINVKQIAGEEQSDKMASDMEELMKQKCVSEFLHTEKMAPIDIHQYFLNVSENQTVDVSMVK